jgi:hypothetical protein
LPQSFLTLILPAQESAKTVTLLLIRTLWVMPEGATYHVASGMRSDRPSVEQAANAAVRASMLSKEESFGTPPKSAGVTDSSSSLAWRVRSIAVVMAFS